MTGRDWAPKESPDAQEAAGPSPASPTPMVGADQVLYLQRMAGNRAVAARLSVQRSAESDLIDAHTSWYGNLAEDELGRALLTRAVGGEYQFVQAVLNEVGWHNRDDVSLELMKAATNDQLSAIAGSDGGRRLL